MINVTDESFQKDVLEADMPVVVDFWADWCGPCKLMAPMLEELEIHFADKVIIAKMDIDANPETPTQYGVRGIPALKFFDEGECKDTKIGAVPQGDITRWIDSLEILSRAERDI